MRTTPRVLAALSAFTLLALVSACGGTAGGASGGDRTVTVYSADGLEDWYGKRFDEFKAKTGISVQLVSAGSGEVVSRLEKEKANPQADLVVTLPPFVQRADEQNLLADSKVAGFDQVAAGQKDPAGHYVSIMNNYLCFIASTQAQPAPKTWQDLLDPKYKGKVQYSTPGQAGDGTAVLLQLQHVYGNQGALDYLGKLEANNAGPSASTGKLQPKVSKGELLVANGDVQMNLASIATDHSDFDVFFPADDSGKRSTLALPYLAGLTAHAPHADNGRQLLEFLLSADVQKTTTQAYGQPARRDVTADDATGEQLAQVLAGVDVWSPDWTAVLSSLDSDVAAYTKAVGR
jgi:2-aminoethylphosphonate transport system substrate-binding protein